MPRKTWNVGEVLTAVDMNTFVRDNSVIRCTSTTRPTGLGAADRGTYIFETDTGYELVWYGATTGFLPTWRQSWGQVASYSPGLSGDFVADSPIATLTAPVIPGRLYKISGSSRWGTSSAASAIAFARFMVTNATLTFSAGAVTGETGASVPGTSPNQSAIPLNALFAVSAVSSVNLTLWARGSTGSLIRHIDGFYILEDVGPIFAPPAA